MNATFTIIDQTGTFTGGMGSGANGVDASFGSGAAESGMGENRATGASFTEAASTSAMNGLANATVSSLNQATGGVAGQVYKLSKAASKGTAAAMGVGVTAVAIWAVQKGLQALEKRIAEMEAKAAEANERDNVLIRAGTKSYATLYQGGILGIKSTSR